MARHTSKVTTDIRGVDTLVGLTSSIVYIFALIIIILIFIINISIIITLIIVDIIILNLFIFLSLLMVRIFKWWTFWRPSR